MHRIWLSVFGTGFSPIISGTCGSAVVTLIFIVAALCGLKEIPLLALLLLIAAHGFYVTIKYGHHFIEEFGPDPKQLVSDEQCGQAVTYLWLWPFVAGIQDILVIGVAGFVLFRIFDIIKPPPVRQLEAVKGSWGILLDDIMAGIYAAIVLQILYQNNLLPVF